MVLRVLNSRFVSVTIMTVFNVFYLLSDNDVEYGTVLCLIGGLHRGRDVCVERKEGPRNTRRFRDGSG